MEIGNLVRFNHERDGGPVHRVVSVMADGMVEIHDMGGYFAPHLFAIADDIAGIPPTPEDQAATPSFDLVQGCRYLADAVADGYSPPGVPAMLRDAAATISDLRERLREAEKETAEELKWLRGQVFALCEDTEAECASSRLIDGQAGDYARGRVKEAKSIRNAIGVVVEERLRMEKM